ncbi:MAG: hypothetical protein ACR2PX_22345 [Endozoicomonas sp.]|uniref:hypothetical protein n=1 Tax=Endozoicomonas sp. TaxID=1892382 RepID=UPI003D9B8EB7
MKNLIPLLVFWLGMISLPGQTQVLPGGQFSVVTYNVAGLPSWINNLDTDRFEPMGE